MRLKLAHEKASDELLTLMTRHIKLFGKCFRRMQQASIARFVKLPGSNHLVRFYWDCVNESTLAPPNSISGNDLLPLMNSMI
jgi:hypothetical protein